MGKRTDSTSFRSKTLPSSPTHSLSSSSSSSDFEFRISISPRKSSAALCPADELFYKGQLLPLHRSPRISMVRTLLLASSSTSSASDTNTTASRDSSSSNDSTSSSFAADLSLLAPGDPIPFCDSSRPSSVTEDENHIKDQNKKTTSYLSSSKYFSLSRFSNVFKKDNTHKTNDGNGNGSSSVKKMSYSAKEVIRKYLKKVKPFYEKLSVSSKPNQNHAEKRKEIRAVLLSRQESKAGGGGSELTQSFSGNLKSSKMIGRSYAASCPCSMRSSPSHSGVLTRAGLPMRVGLGSNGNGSSSSETSTMEELQNAIQGAIAHCKNSMVQNSSSSFSNNSSVTVSSSANNGKNIKGKGLLLEI
ncbi:unnamed protein product [Amaranthus hypochondriacus]